MFDIAYFNLALTDTSSPTYKLYEQLYLNNMLLRPVIYTDRCAIQVSHNIPIFSTFYIRNTFYESYILLDYKDFIYTSQHIHNKCIVVYDPVSHNIQNMECCGFINLEEKDNIIQTLKEMIK